VNESVPDTEPKRQVQSKYSKNRKLELASKWYLGKISKLNGREEDSDKFWSCKVYEGNLRLSVSKQYDGESQMFTITALNVPIVDKRVAEVIASVASTDIQLVPVSIGHINDEYFILNVIRSCRCIDESRSMFSKWTEKDRRPEKIGDYKMMLKAVIDPRQATDAEIFRVVGWDIMLAVSEKLKTKLETIHTTGISFIPLA